MSAENYLMDIKQSDRRIGELVRLQTMMAGTPAPNEQIARDRAALEEQITRGYEDNLSERKRAQRFIDRLPDPTERQALTLFYLRHLTCDEAAEIMGFTPRQLYRVKRRALMHLEGLLL